MPSSKLSMPIWDKIVFEIKDWAFWIGAAIIIATIVGNILAFTMGNQTPLVAVMSGSMMHTAESTPRYLRWMESNNFTSDQIASMPFSDGFNKGDVLIIVSSEEISVGDVIVFHVPNSKYPIIHRIVEIVEQDSTLYYKTKGDHNAAIDSWLTPESAIEGKAVFKVPIVGYIKVIPIELWNSLSR